MPAARRLHIAVTGASGGLGRALAAWYARGGALLSLAGRSGKRLAETAGLCGVFTCEARTSSFDVTDSGRLEKWLAEADALAPLDIVIAAAGVASGPGPDGLEDPAALSALLRVNTEAAALTALFAARLMAPRRRGQIALISSQAGRMPLVNTPGYSASKAGLRVWGLAARESLARSGVGLTVASPGYFKSPMQERFGGRQPFTWTAERAAAHIAEKLRKNPAEISFPMAMSLLIGLGGLLPGALRRPLSRLFSFTVKS